jgi:hypothetical protein
VNGRSIIFEFGRQLAQLCEANSITETTFAKVARRVLAYLNGALKSWRIVAISLDSEGGVFDGTAFQAMVLEMEKQMRRLNERINGLLAAAEEEATVDTFFMDPVVDALIEMGGIISRSTAERRWSKGKFAADKSQWDETPNFATLSLTKFTTLIRESPPMRRQATWSARDYCPRGRPPTRCGRWWPPRRAP